ncbi:hypothetical protein LTR64_005884 [Lithohypha guttulata]|uniref:uncharacterized protein n=1 Tax=Lithohypha guttulata TaxID=1690604 RepID=UPI002DE197D8|nr:hypothetical protein LTR51_002321 [Lithohypha guttulata]
MSSYTPSTSPPFTYPIPSISPGQEQSNANKTILLTGINGYIASHIALLLLSRGYTVLGTSRSASTPSKLLSNPAFAPFANTGRLKHVVVSDITVKGAFDEAMQGVHGVIHTASPVDWTLTSVDAFFTPAVGGVKSILTSAYKHNREKNGKVSSFVQLSSILAIVDKWKYLSIADGGLENRDFTEKDWNETGESVARASEKAQHEGTGKFLPMVAYGASKAVAEKWMWDFIEQCAKEDGGKWLGPACTSINPGVVMGPPVNWPERPEKLNETLLPVWNIYSGKCKEDGKLPMQIGGATYCDVRDVAALHVWALENPDKAGGERYLATNGKAPPQAFADCMRETIFKDEEKIRGRIIVGEPGKGYVMKEKDGAEFDYGWPASEPTVKATKAYQALGVERFKGLEEILRDTTGAFRERWPDTA